ncbi:MAG: glycosyltransferase family 2 protein [Candidatus Omnitrophota bacterium]
MMIRISAKRSLVSCKKIGFATDYIHKGKYKTVSVSHNPSCNAIYRKEVLLKEDGFRRGLWPGEDVELDYRLRKRGYRLVFNPKAVIFHYRIPTPKSYINMMYRYGYVQAFMVRAYGIFRTIQLFPFILLGLICIMVLSIFFKPMIAYYLIAIFSLSLPFVLSHLYSRTLSLLVITLFYWNIGFLCGFFSPKNPITNNT